MCTVVPNQVWLFGCRASFLCFFIIRCRSLSTYNSGFCLLRFWAQADVEVEASNLHPDTSANAKPWMPLWLSIFPVVHCECRAWHRSILLSHVCWQCCRSLIVNHRIWFFSLVTLNFKRSFHKKPFLVSYLVLGMLLARCNVHAVLNALAAIGVLVESDKSL